MIVIVRTYIVQIALQNSCGKVVFLGGTWNPLGHQREWKYLGHLSVDLVLWRRVVATPCDFFFLTTFMVTGYM